MRHPDDNVELDGEICGEPGCDCRDRPVTYTYDWPGRCFLCNEPMEDGHACRQKELVGLQGLADAEPSTYAIKRWARPAWTRPIRYYPTVTATRFEDREAAALAVLIQCVWYGITYPPNPLHRLIRGANRPWED